MTPAARKKIQRANAAKARAALAAKRAQGATGRTVREIPLHLIPVDPVARTPAAGASTPDRKEVDALAQIIVAVFEEYRRRSRVK